MPLIYAVLLILTAILVWLGTPKNDITAEGDRSLSERLAPLKHIQVWRFSLYYVAVFGAYVALSSWLPNYYTSHFTASDGAPVSLTKAALITASFHLPSIADAPSGIGCQISGSALRHEANFCAHAGRRCDPRIARGILPFLVMFGSSPSLSSSTDVRWVSERRPCLNYPTYFQDVGAVGGLVGMSGWSQWIRSAPALFAAATPAGYRRTFLVMAILVVVCIIWMEISIDRIEKVKPTRKRIEK